MGKTYIDSVKYIISIEFEIIGVVDKPDIIGAVFGQSEGLLGDSMDLRELQQSGRVGRIDLTVQNLPGKVRGTLTIPTSMDMVETCILAAAVETVDKVGPFEGTFKTKSIEDTRSAKRHEIVERAKILLQQFHQDQMPDTTQIAEQVRTETRVSDLVFLGQEKLPAGPAVKDDPEIIVVEGRADVLNLLKNHIRNAVAMNGARPSRELIELCRRKKVTLFIDGDRGGELNLRQLMELTPITFVARAPDGKEVEELTRKEIVMALRRRVPASQALNGHNGHHVEENRSNQVVRPNHPIINRPFNVPSPIVNRPVNVAPPIVQTKVEEAEEERRPIIISRVKEEVVQVTPKPLTIIKVKPVENPFEKNLSELKGTLNAQFLDENQKVIGKAPVREIISMMPKFAKKAKIIVMDGIITKRVVDMALQHNILTVVGIKKAKFDIPKEVTVIA